MLTDAQLLEHVTLDSFHQAQAQADSVDAGAILDMLDQLFPNTETLPSPGWSSILKPPARATFRPGSARPQVGR